MYNYKIFGILFFNIVLSPHIILSQKQWVDPHDMNIRKNPLPGEVLASHNNNCECPSPSISECDSKSINFAISHYKRLINMLLRCVVIDRSETSIYKGQLYLNIPLEEYEKLKSFSGGNMDDSVTLREIDKILSKVLVKPSYEHIMDNFISWIDQIYFTFYNRTTGILFACILTLYLSYKLLKANLTIWTITKYVICFGWVIDFAFTWISLLQLAEINKVADTYKYSSIPTHCDPSVRSTWQYLSDIIFKTDSCREYHQTFFLDYIWSVSPLKVFGHQIGALILSPAEQVGSAIGMVTRGIMDSLPFYISFLVLPILLIFAAIIFCILLSFITQTSFSCNILHILHLDFGKKERKALSDSLSGSNLSALINVMHRNMIEEVKQADTVERTTEASNFRGAIESKSICEDTKSEPIEGCDNKEVEHGAKSDTCEKTLDGSGDNG